MDKLKFQNTDKLYHYTSIDSAIKIINEKSLKFGDLKKMNDINEAYRYIFYEEEIDPKKVEEELSNYRQISLTRDHSPRPGYYIPAMWGHYAERGNGVCLVFDRSQLISSLKKLSYDIATGNIEYLTDCDGSIYIEDNNNIPQFFIKHRTNLFFKKTPDWSYEQEFRILCKKEGNETLFFPFQDSLMAIIMNFAPDVDYKDSVFNSKNVEKIKEEDSKIPVLELGNWDGAPNLRDSYGDSWNDNDNHKID